MLPEVLQQPAPQCRIIFKFPGRRVFLPGLDAVVLCPAIEMEHIDPGVVFEYVSEVHAQDNIVTEQQDPCMGVPLQKNYRPVERTVPCHNTECALMLVKFETYSDGKNWCGRGIGVDIFTQGKTLDELMANIREAVELHFEEELGKGESIRILTISETEVGTVARAAGY
jgi:hypothetical protein